MSLNFEESRWNDFNKWNKRDLALGEVWNRKLAQWLNEQGLITSTTSLLDYGCSNFDLGLKLVNSVQRVDGFDPNSEAIAIAARRLPPAANVNLYTQRTEIPERLYDLVVVNSVLQYFPDLDAVAEFLSFTKDRLFSSTQAKLIIGDLIPKKYSPLPDALNSLSVAAGHGVFCSMFVHLAKSALKPEGLKLLRIDKGEIKTLASKVGLECRVLEENLTLSPSRYSAILTPMTEQ